MPAESVRPLDPETLALFAAKGLRWGSGPQFGNANGVKVRRVMQVTADLANRPFDRLHILDLACGEGVYAIEAALRGARVLAVDGRAERMDEGARAARRLGLANVRFEQRDIRAIDSRSHGRFDVIFFLGVLYHLDEHDIFPVVGNLAGMCRSFVVVETQVSLKGEATIVHDGQRYEGARVREHADDDPPDVRRSRALHSLDNTWSFLFTEESLIRALGSAGFSSVFVCASPPGPARPADRVTVVAVKGAPVKLSCYPWVNDKTEAEIEAFLAGGAGAVPPTA